ncbi:MAG: hypothetical protein J6T57_01550 [Alphaproteobacteria bacterium]|nr:hypothetical protein [Alphaproteobacteria bacterium]
MSKNVKYTTYTVMSYPRYDDGIANQVRVAMFGDLEIQQMINYVQQENESEIYVQIAKETKTINYHCSKNNFPWLKNQTVKKGKFNVKTLLSSW